MEPKIVYTEYLPEDHQGFVDCINDFYLGGYPYTKYLDAEYLERKTKEGLMIVLLAKNNDGEIVGTAAAQKLGGVFAGSVLLLMRCIRSGYQHHGIGTEQENILLDLVSKRFSDALSLYADVMTHNTVSQHTLSEHGFVMCGLRMNLYKSEIMVPKLCYPAGTKMSQAVFCKPLVTKEINLYAPKEHKEFIRRIYSALALPCTFLSEGKSCSSDGNGIYSSSIKEAHDSAEFHIELPARDFTDKMIPEIKGYISKGYTAVAYINMCSPECTFVYRELEKIGFYFSGIKPLSQNGEYLIMSNTKNSCVNTDIIKLREENLDFFKIIEPYV